MQYCFGHETRNLIDVLTTSLCVVEPLYYRHPWDSQKCPDWQGIRISGVVLYIAWIHNSVLIKEVSLFQRCPYRGVPLYADRGIAFRSL